MEIKFNNGEIYISYDLKSRLYWIDISHGQYDEHRLDELLGKIHHEIEKAKQIISKIENENR